MPFVAGKVGPRPSPRKTLADRVSEGSSGPITVQQLAERLAISSDDIQSLIDKGYLRIILKKESFEQTVLSCPNAEAVEWLKMMFQPIQLRPLIRLNEVEYMLDKQTKGTRHKYRKAPKTGRFGWNYKISRLRDTCLAGNIPVYLDPIEGELLSISNLTRLIEKFGVYRTRTRFDRANMLTFLLNVSSSNWDQSKLLRVPKYTTKLNHEINRIAHLPIAERTIQAMALYEAWSTSRAVQECLNKMKDSPKRKSKKAVQETDQKMDRLRDSVST